ncbi:MAG: glycosyltransferase family 9 protein [Acidobacteria bacterium]|nr:glycosyltransferase family 9 protein [Acidobacteriota bacterium]
MEPLASPRSILVIRLGAVGDVIRTLPAVSCLRRTWPGARLLWAVEEPSAPLLEGHPDIDATLVLRRVLLKSPLRPGNAGRLVEHLRGFRTAMREAALDATIDFQGTLKSAFIARLSGAARTFGLGAGHARERSHLLYTDRIDLPRGREGKLSRVTRALAMARAIGADTSAPRKILPPREGPAGVARRFLDAEAPERPRVVISPGTSEAQAYKRYPAALFARVSDALVESGVTVVFVWGPGEETIVGQIVRLAKRRSVVAPRTRLVELAEIMRSCDLFIGSDTGPLHLAAAVGLRTLALYGPTDPVVNAAYTDRPGLSMVGDVACSPCRRRGCQNRSCLRLIDPDLVAESARRILAGGPDFEASARLIVAPARG